MASVSSKSKHTTGRGRVEPPGWVAEAAILHSACGPRRPACPARLADKISSPSHWWSIGTRVVWHLLRVSPGAPANLACEGRVACLNGLVRGACQPHSSKRRFASQRPRRNRRRRATGSRRPDCPRRVGVANQSDTHLRVVPTGRGSKGVAPQRDWHSSQRPHLRKVGHGSPRNFLANTRAPPSLRRARCSRTSTFVIVPRRAA
mmetsp:Transcript_2186/g.6514  ORF Transcript_2186/g.6514 Transcript_2186/m.6514 type:complete len:204 (-) Transcript_2186:188-799(-)